MSVRPNFRKMQRMQWGHSLSGRDDVRVTLPIAEPGPNAAHETKHLGPTQPLGERRRRRALDQMVALSLLEVGIDEHGMRRYGLTEWGRRAWRFRTMWTGRSDRR